MKARAGWKETDRRELADPDGEPVAHAHELKDLDKLPLEELTRLYERATRAHN